MKRPDIVKVWGKADNIDLLFKKVGAEWQCSVPADTSDGTYACELIALNDVGNYGFWVGFLYMCSGICHFDLNPVNYKLFFDDMTSSEICFKDTFKRIIFDRRCPHYDR